MLSQADDEKNCYFYLHNEKTHYHLGEVELNLERSETMAEAFKGLNLKFDLGKAFTTEDVDVAAETLMKREYNGSIT